jgi:hypothetical protein
MRSKWLTWQPGGGFVGFDGSLQGEDSIIQAGGTPPTPSIIENTPRYEPTKPTKPPAKVATVPRAASPSASAPGAKAPPPPPPEAGTRSPEWPPESIDAIKRFGSPHTRLFPYLDKRVRCPAGTGVLVQVFRSCCRVILDAQPAINYSCAPEVVFPADWTVPASPPAVEQPAIAKTEPPGVEQPPVQEVCWHCGGTNRCTCIACFENKGACVTCVERAKKGLKPWVQ